VVSVSPTQIVALTPAARGFGQNLTNQVVDVLVKEVNSGFSSIGSQQFKYGTNVRITAMGPGGGSYLGGTRVTIDGSGFEGPVAVSFQFSSPSVSVAQQVVSVSGNQIVILTSPAPLPTTCPTNGLVSATSVTVVNINTGDGDTANLGFNAQIPLPAITGISPNTGGTGANVTVNGHDFSPQNVGVTFGPGTNGSSAQVLSSTATSINLIVPAPPQGFTFDTQPCANNGIMYVAPPVTVTATKTPSSSIHTVPSITGRNARTYVLGVVGALTLNVNVALAPGATVASVCAAGRDPLSQPTPSDAQVSSSFLIPMRASWPRTPLTHGLPPVLRNVSVIGSLVTPGASSGKVDCPTQRL
jgi:hypothetical protein